jgi:drug/metabolite transporter (DMT)-like permease
LTPIGIWPGLSRKRGFALQWHETRKKPQRPHPVPCPAGLLGGLTIAIGGAVLFSTKAIVAKLLYRYQLDAVTVIAFRMLFSLPAFAAIAVWKMRTEAPLSVADRWRLVGLGLIGYYLSSFLDFLGLQYISVGLERLILFLTPTFVLLMTSFALKRHISPSSGWRWPRPTAASCWCSCTTCAGGVSVVRHRHRGLAVLGSAVSYALYLLFSGEMVKRIGSLRLVSYAMCVSSAPASPSSSCCARPPCWYSRSAVYWLSLVNGIFCTILPVFMTMVAVQRIGAATASQAGMVGPVSTLFLGALILGEPVTSVQIAGTCWCWRGFTMLSKKK